MARRLICGVQGIKLKSFYIVLLTEKSSCIILELFTKKPVFQGNDEMHQLDVLYKILGTPTSSDWPGLTEMPWFELIKPRYEIRSKFRELFQKWLSPAALDLVQALLSYNPSTRTSATNALKTPYFTEEQPLEEIPSQLCEITGEWHEFEHKRERARRRRAED